MNNIEELANLMRDKKKRNQPPYALFLGAGASLASGAPNMQQIINDVVGTLGGEDPKTLSEKEKTRVFYNILDRLSSSERYSVLSKYLRHAAPSRGYLNLAQLVREGYFNTILTTNFDTFLEGSLLEAGLRARDITVTIAGADLERLIHDTTKMESTRIWIIKLHGDLSSAFAFTHQEVDEFSEQIKSLLRRFLARNIVIVGHTARDEEINRYFRTASGDLWYVNPDQRQASEFTLKVTSRFITGIYGSFDAFFGELADLLLYRPQKIQIDQEIEAQDGSMIKGVSQHVTIMSSGSAVGGIIVGSPRQVGDEEDKVGDEHREKIESLNRQLSVLRRNLDALETQAAMSGTSKPTYLINQVDSTRAEIARLAEQIERLKREAR
jgi:hypothetical protein